MGSVEFKVGKIAGLSFGSDGKHNQFVILEDTRGDSVFVPAESMDQSVGEVCIGSTLQMEIDDNGTVQGVSQVVEKIPQV